MSQDTRKDKRAKVVSLNVRYKSATVDEFIENHSHDVSKGGIFVKTPTPFPPGTLLKFEIRLAGDKSVISGVGRVVWKREPTQAAADRPAGMGVKFIKIDEASRATIDRLVAHDPSAGRAYTSELTQAEAEASNQPSTLRGLVAAPSASAPEGAKPVPVSVPAPARASSQTLPVPPSGAGPTPSAPLTPPPPKPAFGASSSSRSFGAAAGTAGAVPPKASPPTPRPASAGPPPPVAHKPATAIGVAPAPNGPTSDPRLGGPPRPQAANRKATMMGIGMPSTPPGALQPEATTKPPPAAEPMFPRLDAPDSGNEQVREPTVMKQAAELLEEALKEAGGSMDEIGQNPLFMKTGGEIIATPAPPAPAPGLVDSVRGQSGDTIIMSSPRQNATGPGPGSAPAQPVASAPGVTPVPPAAAPPASAPVAPAPSATGPRPALASGQHGKLADELAPPKKKGGGGFLVVLVLVLVAVGGGAFYAFKTGLLAGIIGPAAPPPSATMSAEPPASAPPSASASAPAMLPEGDAAVADAGASATSTGDAGRAADAGAASGADAGKAAVAPPPQRPTWHPPPPKPPKPPTEPTATTTATSTAPTSTATSTATAPTSTSTGAPTSTSTAPAPAKTSDEP